MTFSCYGELTSPRPLEWVRKVVMGEDLADRLDDLICAWDKVVGTDLDTVVLLLLGTTAPHLSLRKSLSILSN